MARAGHRQDTRQGELELGINHRLLAKTNSGYIIITDSQGLKSLSWHQGLLEIIMKLVSLSRVKTDQFGEQPHNTGSWRHY